MTKTLAGPRVAGLINEAMAGSVVECNDTDVWIQPDLLHGVASFLKDDGDLDFAFLTSISAVDYIEYFEVVYHLRSLDHNHEFTLKTRIYSRDAPSLPSVIDIWQGADLQEREIWDLMGVRFDGHPNMKRILLWEEFPGHPLRKDYLR